MDVVAWALQGAAMIWLSCRQQRRLALLGGLVLQLLAGATFVVQPGTYSADTLPLLNSLFLGAGLIALAGWSSGWWLDRSESPVSTKQVLAPVKWLLLGWSTAWWLWAGFAEIARLFAIQEVLAAGLVFVAFTAGAAAFAAGRLNWPDLNSVGLVLLPAMVIALLISMADRSHPFANYGWLAWPIAVAVHYAFLRFREAQLSRLILALHTGAYWIVAGLIALEAEWSVDQWTNGIWPLAASIAAVAAFLLGTLRGREALPCPWGSLVCLLRRVCGRSRACRYGGGARQQSGFVRRRGAVTLSADSQPPDAGQPLLAVCRMALATRGRVVAVRRWISIPHRGGRRSLSAHDGSGSSRPSLGRRPVRSGSALRVRRAAIVAFDRLECDRTAGYGARRPDPSARDLDRCAVLMTVVVIKLFLVELDNTGTVARVVSFLGVGVLLLIVGYYSPVPPRLDAEAETAR